MNICWKILNLFIQALETGQKRNLWHAFLACYEPSTNKKKLTDDICYFVDLAISRIPKQQPKVTYKGTVKIIFKGIFFLIDTLL